MLQNFAILKYLIQITTKITYLSLNCLKINFVRYLNTKNEVILKSFELNIYICITLNDLPFKTHNCFVSGNI